MSNARMDDYWTPEQLAARLKVREGMVRTMCRDGHLRAVRVGKKLWRIPAREVRERYPDLFEDTTGPAA